MFCATLLLILLNGSQWEFKDLRNVKAAAVTCERTYGTCLKEFTKKETRRYSAKCE